MNNCVAKVIFADRRNESIQLSCNNIYPTSWKAWDMLTSVWQTWKSIAIIISLFYWVLEDEYLIELIYFTFSINCGKSPMFQLIVNQLLLIWKEETTWCDDNVLLIQLLKHESRRTFLNIFLSQNDNSEQISLISKLHTQLTTAAKQLIKYL